MTISPDRQHSAGVNLRRAEFVLLLSPLSRVASRHGRISVSTHPPAPTALNRRLFHADANSDPASPTLSLRGLRPLLRGRLTPTRLTHARIVARCHHLI